MLHLLQVLKKEDQRLVRCLPGTLANAGQESERGHLAEGDAAEAELAHVGAGATGDGAAILESGGRAVARQRLELELEVPLLARVVGLFELLLERGTLALVLGVHLAALEVAVDVGGSGHASSSG